MPRFRYVAWIANGGVHPPESLLSYDKEPTAWGHEDLSAVMDSLCRWIDPHHSGEYQFEIASFAIGVRIVVWIEQGVAVTDPLPVSEALVALVGRRGRRSLPAE